MHPDFSRTLRALEHERRHVSPWRMVLAAGLIGSWLAWAALARVMVLAVSEQARLEVESPPLPLSIPVGGRLIFLKLSLSQPVERGELLAEIDSAIERQRLREEQARMAAIEAELVTLRREAPALEQALRAEQEVARLTGRITQARIEEAARRTAHAEEIAERYRRLKEAAPEVEVRRTQAEAGQQQAVQQTLRAEETRQRGDRRALKLSAQVRMEALRRELAILSGRRSTAAATITLIEAEIERHRVRAPATGYIDAIAPLSVGAFVQAGDNLGVLLPAAPLRVVALVQPAAAFGRIAAGQRAWLRLAGFPFTQYGRLALRVSRRANEVRDGLVRVELALDPSVPFPVPLQHGLPGTADIEVERVSPLRLIARTIGKLGTRTELAAATEPGR